jgi:hypothetical protein
MRLLAQVASRFLVIIGLLVLTDRSLLGMYLLSLRLGAIYSVAVGLVKYSDRTYARRFSAANAE